jgi:hypothetical protein
LVHPPTRGVRAAALLALALTDGDGDAVAGCGVAVAVEIGGDDGAVVTGVQAENANERTPTMTQAERM